MSETWIVEPLKGKYYGTIVKHTDTGEVINVWLGGHKPSSRELANGWQDGDGYDHVETLRSHKAAMYIADALNDMEKMK